MKRGVARGLYCPAVDTACASAHGAIAYAGSPYPKISSVLYMATIHHDKGNRWALFGSAADFHRCSQMLREQHFELTWLQLECTGIQSPIDAIIWGASVTIEDCKVALGQTKQTLPQVMIGGIGDSYLRLQARRIGVLSFLPADFQQEELLWAVRNVLQHSQRTKSEPEASLFLRNLIDKIDQQLKTGGVPDVNSLCRHLNLSQSGLYRRVKEATGKSTQQLLLERKCHRAAHLLRENGQPIAEIAYACGFSGPAHLSAVFRKRYGYSPREFRHQALVDKPYHADD